MIERFLLEHMGPYMTLEAVRVVRLERRVEVRRRRWLLAEASAGSVAAGGKMLGQLHWEQEDQQLLLAVLNCWVWHCSSLAPDSV